VHTGARALSGITVSGVRRQVRAPGPTVSMVGRASTCPPTSSAVSAPTCTSETRASSSTPAGHRRALTEVAAPSSRATATLVAVDPATEVWTVAFTTRVQALLASMAAVVPPCRTPPSG